MQIKAKHCKAMQSNAKQCKAKQCKAMQSNAKQCHAMQCNAMLNNAENCEAVQNFYKNLHIFQKNIYKIFHDYGIHNFLHITNFYVVFQDFEN